MSETAPTESTEVASALRNRTGASPQRAKHLAWAYVLAVTSASEVPPTASSSAPVGLLMRVMHHFDDVPTTDEVAALFQVTPATARRLLDDVMAVSDDTSTMSLVSVFSRADRAVRVGPDGAIPYGFTWTFASRADMDSAKSSLEFRGVRCSVVRSRDGVHTMVIDRNFVPPGRD